jgi:hypothetical protein
MSQRRQRFEADDMTNESASHEDHLFDRTEFDKIPGAWVFTAWLRNGEGVFRLRLSVYTDQEDVFDLVCEMRTARETEFTVVATVDSCAYEFVHLNERLGGWTAIPGRRRDVFLEMISRVGRIFLVTDLGCGSSQRYPGEPLTSRDYFEFGPSDDGLRR